MYSYLIRRKILNLFGAKFHVYDNTGKIIGFCQQKAFKLKEDIRVYTDESKSVELLSIRARQIIDFSACYDVFDSATQQWIGSWRRKGFTSLIRDKWEMLDTAGNVVAEINEDSMEMALIRRFVCNLIPQSFSLTSYNGMQHATYSQRFWSLAFKLEVSLSPGCQVHPLLVLSGGILLAAIEGRQR